MTIEASSVSDMFQKMQAKLSRVVPELELRLKAELAYEINLMKKEKNAIILGHNYMEPALFYAVADITGDSLALSREAMRATHDVIVFCGVKFMAETAKILNPRKKVLLPSERAGCSLAEGITAADVRQLKKRYPGVPVVSYVNTYADVKAESDYCCTSGNAVELIRALGTRPVIFLPDEYLAKNVAQELGRPIRIVSSADFEAEQNGDEPLCENTVIGWQGRCEVHERFSIEDIDNIRSQLPGVAVLSHPECRPEVVAASDFSGSTQAMIRYVETMDAPQYLMLTECAMGDNVAATFPQKDMVRMCSIRCPHMNQITLEQTLVALHNDQYEIDVPEPIRSQASRALLRMIEVG
jgi:quinolinate synthase